MAEKRLRGFAAMSPEKKREIASKGGRAAHAKGTAHEFTPDEAREAGRKGGQAAHLKGTAHQFTSEEAREAGRKGGQSSHASRTAVNTVSNPETGVSAPALTGGNGVSAPEAVQTVQPPIA